MSRPTYSKDFVETVILAAEEHGKQSEPDHEIGDLQEALRVCWRLMTTRQREEAADLLHEQTETWRTDP